MSDTIEIIYGEEICVTNDVSGSEGEICSLEIFTCDRDNTGFMLFLTKEQVEKTIQALNNILSQEDNL